MKVIVALQNKERGELRYRLRKDDGTDIKVTCTAFSRGVVTLKSYRITEITETNPKDPTNNLHINVSYDDPVNPKIIKNKISFVYDKLMPQHRNIEYDETNNITEDTYEGPISDEYSGTWRLVTDEHGKKIWKFEDEKYEDLGFEPNRLTDPNLGAEIIALEGRIISTINQYNRAAKQARNARSENTSWHDEH